MSDPLVIPAGYAEAVFQVFLNGRAKPFSWSLGVQLHTDEHAAAIALGEWFADPTSPGYANLLANAYTTGPVNVTGHSAFFSFPTSQAGQDSSSNMSPGVAAKIKKITNVRGKANKGYMYWPGVLRQLDVDDGGNIAIAGIDFLNTCIGGLLTAMSTASLVPVVLHRATSSVTTPTPVSDLVVLPLVRSQRRRQVPR